MIHTIIHNNIEQNLSIGKIIELIRNNITDVFYKIINDQKILINNSMTNVQFICHRINEVSSLDDIDDIFGVEIDIRDNNTDQLILSHDPFNDGDYLDVYLSKYKNKTLILNIKSERTELKCLELIKKYNIDDYFFLDSSFPMIYLLNTKYNNNNIASRYSEYESLENSLVNKNFIKWIWIDCFSYLPLDEKIYNEIQKINKKICIVSPELQKQPHKIIEYKKQLSDNNIIPDAICCKKYNIINWL